MVRGVAHSKALLDSLSDLAVDAVSLAKNGLGFGSIGKMFDVMNHAKSLIVEAPLAFPELMDLDQQEASDLSQAAYLCVKKIVEAVKR